MDDVQIANYVVVGLGGLRGGGSVAIVNRCVGLSACSIEIGVCSSVLPVKVLNLGDRLVGIVLLEASAGVVRSHVSLLKYSGGGQGYTSGGWGVWVCPSIDGTTGLD